MLLTITEDKAKSIELTILKLKVLNSFKLISTKISLINFNCNQNLTDFKNKSSLVNFAENYVFVLLNK